MLARTATWVDRLRARPLPTLGRSALALLPWALLAPPLVTQLAVTTRRIGPVVVLWLVAFTPQLVVLPLVSLTVGIVGRRRLLVAAAALVTLGHLVVLWPALRPADPPTIPAGSVPLRVVFSNIYAENSRLADALARLAAQQPDVLVLAEAQGVDAAALDAAGLTDLLPYAAPLDPVRSGMVVRSRYPVRIPDAYRGRPSPDMVLDVGGDAVRLVAVHTRSPLGTTTAESWKTQLAKLRASTWSDELPMVVIGDFNATRWHGPYHRLLGDLRDAHDLLGQALSTSWPNDRWFPAQIRLDHVLVRGRVLPADLRDLDVPGSDHKGLVADLALAPTG